MMVRLLMHICITQPQWVNIHLSQPECLKLTLKLKCMFLLIFTCVYFFLHIYISYMLKCPYIIVYNIWSFRWQWLLYHKNQILSIKSHKRHVRTIHTSTKLVRFGMLNQWWPNSLTYISMMSSPNGLKISKLVCHWRFSPQAAMG